MKRIGLLLVLALGFAGVLAAAEPPESMNYQGVLRDSFDYPIDGTRSMVFRFYNVSTGGTALLEETHAAIDVDNGLFNARLGLGTITPAMAYDSLADLFADENELYLGVAVDLDGEMTPRIPLNATAWALNADRLDGRDADTFADSVHGHTGADITGAVGDADKLDGKHGSEFIDISATAQTKEGALTLSSGLPGYDFSSVDLVPSEYQAADLSCESVLYSPTGTPYPTTAAATLAECGGGTGAYLTSRSVSPAGANPTFDATAALALSSGKGGRFVGQELDNGLSPVSLVTVDLAAPGDSQFDPTAFGGKFELNRNECHSLGYCTISRESCDTGTPCPPMNGAAKLALREDGKGYGIQATGTDYAGYFDGRVLSLDLLEFPPGDNAGGGSSADLTPSPGVGGDLECGWQRVGGLGFGPDYAGEATVELAACGAEQTELGAHIFASSSELGDMFETREATADLAHASGIGGSFVGRSVSYGTEQSRASVNLADVNTGVGVQAVADSVGAHFETNGVAFPGLPIDAPGTGVYAKGTSQAGYFEGDYGESIVKVAKGGLGVESLAAFIGGTFNGSDYGVKGTAAGTGVWGQGSQAGGFFRDGDPLEAFVWLGYTAGADKYGIYARAPVDAGYFEGNVTVTDNLTVQDNVQLGNATNDSHTFWGTLTSGSASDQHKILPAAGNWGLVGDATNYWYFFYGNTYFAKNTSLIAFDKYSDLDLLDAMEMVDYTDPKSGRELDIFAPDTLPPMIKGDPAVDGPGADQFIDLSKAVGFAFGSLRQMRQEVREQGRGVREEIDLRTADPATGAQTMDGNFQVLLDQGADEHSRFSIFKDGQNGLSQELLRVDEDGNLYLRGALRPASLDLAEYHPVTEPVQAGDVLVVDRDLPGTMRRADTAADPAVVGIVSGKPGILLGSGISRIASADSELASQLELARSVGDNGEEARLWVELEKKFGRTHAPLALSGTVPCKVDAGYGSIVPGDLLTTSPTAGHAMRADRPQPGTILGKALEPLDAGTGMIKVLVMLR